MLSKKPNINYYNPEGSYTGNDVDILRSVIKQNIPLSTRLSVTPEISSSPVVPSTPPMALPKNPSMPTMTPPMGLPMPMPQPEQDDSSNFLGSLIAQGVAGIGTGLMGGSAADIQRSAGMFDSMRSQQASRDKAKLLMDPKSEESKKRRMVFEKALNFKIPDNFSYTDLNDPTVLQGLKGQAEQSRLTTMPRQGGGVGGVGKTSKPEKGTMLEDKDNDELGKINELRNLTNDLANSVKAKGNAWIGGASKEQDTLKYGIAATMGVLKGQGAMTEPDVAFWNKSLAISPSETKEEYTSRLKNLQQRLIDKQITKLKNKGFEVEYRDKENKYYVFPKGDSIDPIGEF
jgi:hypothetical protein